MPPDLAGDIQPYLSGDGVWGSVTCDMRDGGCCPALASLREALFSPVHLT